MKENYEKRGLNTNKSDEFENLGYMTRMVPAFRDNLGFPGV